VWRRVHVRVVRKTQRGACLGVAANAGDDELIPVYYDSKMLGKDLKIVHPTNNNTDQFRIRFCVGDRVKISRQLTNAYPRGSLITFANPGAVTDEKARYFMAEYETQENEWDLAFNCTRNNEGQPLTGMISYTKFDVRVHKEGGQEAVMPLTFYLAEKFGETDEDKIKKIPKAASHVDDPRRQKDVRNSYLTRREITSKPNLVVLVRMPAFDRSTDLYPLDATGATETAYLGVQTEALLGNIWAVNFVLTTENFLQHVGAGRIRDENGNPIRALTAGSKSRKTFIKETDMHEVAHFFTGSNDDRLNVGDRGRVYDEDIPDTFELNAKISAVKKPKEIKGILSPANLRLFRAPDGGRDPASLSE